MQNASEIITKNNSQGIIFRNNFVSEGRYTSDVEFLHMQTYAPLRLEFLAKICIPDTPRICMTHTHTHTPFHAYEARLPLVA